MIFAPRLIARWEPWITPDLERLAKALGTMVDPLLELAEEEGSDGHAGYVPPYGRLLEVERCPGPDLPYLGNYVGVTVPQGSSEAEARALVKAESGLERCTRASLEAAIARVLGEGVPFMIQERTNAASEPDAYHFLVLIGSGLATTALREAIGSQKPAGVFFTILEVEDSWIAGKLKWSEISAGRKWTELTEGTY